MTVKTEEPSEQGEVEVAEVPMRNNIVTSVISVIVWVIIVVMNVALLVLVGMGKAS
jgi:metal iron transporter